MMLIIAGVLTLCVVTISIKTLKSMPMKLQRLIARRPMMAVLFNLGISYLLTGFMGIGMIAGVSNLLGSVIFAGYCQIAHR